MTRLLVLCSRDWLDARAGVAPHFLRELLPRLGLRGYEVSLLTHRPLPWPGRPSLRIEKVSGIQIARMGRHWVYPATARIFLRRLDAMGERVQGFDIVAECIDGKPIPASDHTQLPVLPLVFRLDSRLRAAEDLPSAVAACTASARAALAAAGAPAHRVVDAVADAGTTERAWEQIADRISAALAGISQPGS